MTAPNPESRADQSPSGAHRDALAKEYGEVSGNFRLLTDIRFKLLAFLPVAAGAATALLSAGGGRDGAAEVRALALSMFGLAVTVALATYNDRNDQLYDTLVGRAASIERQLGLSDGAFANRPASWFAVSLPVVRRKWSINHRTPVAWIYGTSVALWIFSACAAGVQLVWGDDPAPRGILAAAIVPAIVLPMIVVSLIRTQRRQRQDQMRADAAVATRCVVGRGLADVAEDDAFLKICERLGGVSPKDARTRARFYSRLSEDERRRFMPEEPDDFVAAHFVALISDLPAEWIHDCATERRKPFPLTEAAAAVHSVTGGETDLWREDPKIDVLAGSDVYAQMLGEWGSLSRGVFTPENIVERRGKDEVTVSFDLDGKRREVTSKVDEGPFDIRIIEQLQPMLAADGPRFHLYDAGDQTVGLAIVTDAEAAELACRLGHRFM
jgi:hypothetical protein